MELVERTNGKYYQEVYKGHNITLKIGTYGGFINEDAEHDDFFYSPKISLYKGEVMLDFKISYAAEDIPKLKSILDDIEAFIPEYKELVKQKKAGL